MIKAHFQTFAGYNAWANARVFDTCGELSPAKYMKARASFLQKTLHGTLNHILVGDRIWLWRLRGDVHEPLPLDTEMYSDLESLRVARIEQDAAIADFVDGLNEGQFACIIVYRNLAGAEFRDPINRVLDHVFNTPDPSPRSGA